MLPQVGDEVLVMFNAAGQPLYFHSDDLGNVLALTDAGGSIVERYDYADYGLPQFLDAKGDPILAGGVPVTASPAGNPFLFHGMQLDAETGLYRDGVRARTNPYFKDNNLQGNMPTRRGNRLYVGGLSWSSGGAPYDPNLGRTLTRAPGDVLIDMKDQSLKKSFLNPWSGGGGRGGAGGMRAGISTSRSNLRNKSARAEDSSGGAETRAGISTSRSNLRNKSARAEDSSGGAGTRTGISTSRSNLRNKSARAEDSSGGAETRAGISTSRSNLRNRSGLVNGSSGGGEVEVIFNPKEYNVSKVTVRGWDPKQKQAILGKSTALRGHRDVGGYRAGLIVPIAMDKSLRFARREGGRTVGAGQVIEIVK